MEQTSAPGVVKGPYVVQLDSAVFGEAGLEKTEKVGPVKGTKAELDPVNKARLAEAWVGVDPEPKFGEPELYELEVGLVGVTVGVIVTEVTLLADAVAVAYVVRIVCVVNVVPALTEVR